MYTSVKEKDAKISDLEGQLAACRAKEQEYGPLEETVTLRNRQLKDLQEQIFGVTAQHATVVGGLQVCMYVCMYVCVCVCTACDCSWGAAGML